jgi:membrane protein
MAVIAQFFRNLRRACWRAFQHDVLAVAKGAAFSSILTLFPALMFSASILATTHRASDYMAEVSAAVRIIFPPGTAQTAQTYFARAAHRPIGVLILASLVALWTASGVMISWMEGFRNAYQIPKTWGIVKERLISFGLVIMAGIPLTFATVLVAFGNQIEARTVAALGHQLGPYVLLLGTVLRWLVAILTSVAVMQLIYHNAVPRTLPWHTVLPGAALSTAVWFPAAAAFGWYVRHFAAYSLFYGSLATAVVLLIWLYILSVIVLVGAEYNALLYPRPVSDSSGMTVVADEKVGAR